MVNSTVKNLTVAVVMTDSWMENLLKGTDPYEKMAKRGPMKMGVLSH